MKTSILLAGLLPLSAAAFAQEAPRPDAAAADPASPTIVVTANRAPVEADRVAASVTVLDKAAIDRAQDIGVSELLLRTPGVTLSRTGGYGTATSLRIRGAESEQTVVVIDGVKFSDPSLPAGGYNFADLLVGDASRIEVLRGPQSTLWGSNAIGGVVNIVTPLPAKALEGGFDLETGSRETVNARAALGGRSGPVTWRFGATSFTTQNISALAPGYGGGERDPYTNRTVTGRVEVALAHNLSADLRGYYTNARGDYDGFAGDSPEYGLTREFVGYAGLNLALLDGRFRNRVAYGYTDTDRDTFDPRLPRTKTFDSDGRNKRLEYQGSLAIADGWNAIFGLEREISTFNSVSPPSSLAVPIPAPTRGRARLMGEYAQLNATVVTGLTLTGGVRHDDQSLAGGKWLFQAGGVWALPTGTTLRANYGEGFKAPSLYQLFSIYGNTALRPEQSHGWEAGAEQKLLDGRITAGATYFERRSRDLITFVSCPFGGPTPAICFQPGTTITRFGYYNNVARALARGVEVSAAARPVDGLTVDGNYTWNLAEDRSPGSATYGFQLARRPRTAANASVSYDWPFGLTTGAAVRRAGHSFDNAANTTRLAGYTLVDLRAEWALTPSLRLFARVENLFDKAYMTAFRYGTLGRSVYGGFRGRF